MRRQKSETRSFTLFRYVQAFPQKLSLVRVSSSRTLPIVAYCFFCFNFRIVYAIIIVWVLLAKLFKTRIVKKNVFCFSFLVFIYVFLLLFFLTQIHLHTHTTGISVVVVVVDKVKIDDFKRFGTSETHGFFSEAAFLAFHIQLPHRPFPFRAANAILLHMNAYRVRLSEEGGRGEGGAVSA